MSADQTKRWRARVESLGLDPDLDALNYRILRTTHSLEEFKKWYNAPAYHNPKKCDLTTAKVDKLPDALMRRHVERHITGECVIEDPEVIKAIENRVKTFYTFVSTTAEPLLVTAAKPKIITHSGNYVYSTVTIEDGGYIRILAACHFECQTLNNISGAANAIQVLGIDGKDAPNGNSPAQPKQAANGSKAQCDCCGGLVLRQATIGNPGTRGDDGKDAQTNGEAGQPGPTVLFTVTDNLPSFVSFLNQGGRGGKGGDGGTGAQGGKGGNGGDGNTCGAFHPDGANGGEGGKGGNGGNGSNGNDGGPGGALTITVPVAQEGNVAVTLGAASGGAKGNRGFKGQGGPGGDGGSNGGSTGEQGKPGDTDGNDGLPGNPGSKGSATVNGKPVG
jgi:hypothetical protein